MENVLSPKFVEVLRELGFSRLTPVQELSIPLMLDGQDVVARSKTGSGKTAAFALPILERLAKDFATPRAGVRPEIAALVLCPTRELCTQVAREIRKFGRRMPGLQVLIVSGGIPGGPQRAALEKGVHIVVGTPGRVLDHLTREALDVRQVRTLVLDEADRMLDMGFQQDMEKILGAMPSERQTVLFSATYPSSIAKLSRKYQRNPQMIEIDHSADGTGEKAEIVQNAYAVEPGTKDLALLALLAEIQPKSAMIFCNLKQTVGELTRRLMNAGVSVAGLSGDLEQNARDRVMAKFRNQSTRVLVATDVASRGIDVDNLDLVVNYEIPHEEEVYVHRVGRTGRAGKRGLAISLFYPLEKRRLTRIEKFTKQTVELKPVPMPVPVAAKIVAPMNLVMPVSPVTPVGEKASARVVAAPKRSFGPIATKPLALPSAAMETLYISGGRKEKMRPGDILGALTGEAGGLPAAQVGKIEIHDHFSYVAVSREVARIALARLRNGRIKGRKFRVEPVK